MDGNGRWAGARDLPRIAGHTQGAQVVETITEWSREIGIRYLTLYAFSMENWNRPRSEVDALMGLLVDFLESKCQKMLANDIRLNAIGNLAQLAPSVRERLSKTMADTAGGRSMVLTLALSYGSRDEICRAQRKIIRDILDKKLDPAELSEQTLSHYLDTASLPDPDLIIRTSGEYRISNFLLWQGAYAELCFVDETWPEFTPEILTRCLLDYQNRERRFGLTSEQLG